MPEKRKDARMPCYLQGEIYVGATSQGIPCEVHDISERGMKIRAPEIATLPDTFRVRIPRRAIFEAVRVVRRAAGEIGVMYEWAKA